MDADGCAPEPFAVADTALNAPYGVLHATLDPAGQRNLKAAERARVAVRDPECILRIGDDARDTAVNGSMPRC